VEQRNQITIYSEKKSYEEKIKTYELMKINGSEITAFTNQENCIREDKLQLSSFVVTEFEEITEPYEFMVGKFLKKGTVTKKVVKGEVDKRDLLQLLKLSVLDVFNFYGREISSENIKSISELIYKNYYWLKLSEFKLFIEKMKSGHWQQVHNLSPAVFMERLKQFSDESHEIREMIAETLSKEEKYRNEQEKDKPINIPLTEAQRTEFSTLLKELANKIDKNEMQKNTNNIHKNGYETNLYHKQNEFCLNWLTSQNELIKKASQDERSLWFELFKIRK